MHSKKKQRATQYPTTRTNQKLELHNTGIAIHAIYRESTPHMPPMGRPKMMGQLDVSGTATDDLGLGSAEAKAASKEYGDDTHKNSDEGKQVSDHENELLEVSSDEAKSNGDGKRGRLPRGEEDREKKRKIERSKSKNGTKSGHDVVAAAKKKQRNERQKDDRKRDTAARMKPKSRHAKLLIHRVVQQGILDHLKFFPDYWEEYGTRNVPGSPCRYILSSEVGTLMGTDQAAWKKITKFSKDFIRNWRNNLYNKLKLKFTSEFVKCIFVVYLLAITFLIALVSWSQS